MTFQEELETASGWLEAVKIVTREQQAGRLLFDGETFHHVDGFEFRIAGETIDWVQVPRIIHDPFELERQLVMAIRKVTKTVFVCDVCETESEEHSKHNWLADKENGIDLCEPCKGKWNVIYMKIKKGGEKPTNLAVSIMRSCLGKLSRKRRIARHRGYSKSSKKANQPQGAALVPSLQIRRSVRVCNHGRTMAKRTRRNHQAKGTIPLCSLAWFS